LKNITLILPIHSLLSGCTCRCKTIRSNN